MTTITHYIFARFLVLALLLLAPSTDLLANGLPDFTTLVKKTTRSVVNISSLVTNRALNEPTRASYGTGFVIDLGGDKYVITNNHVTEGADDILIRFSDRIELPAKIIGADKLTDVALLSIPDTEGKQMRPVVIGDSENIQVGQWVAAIGSPFSFDYSVTAGIISALGRSLPDETYVPFIQSDVAVNQGNSGGPLFNLDGEVIGINSRIFSRTGTYAGLSFAIPIHIALEVAIQLRDKGSVTRGFLGVSIRDVTRDLIKPFGLKKAQGALVVEVFKESAADKGGIRNGDIIVGYQGQEIVNSGDLPVMVGRTKPGKKAKFVVLRNGERKTLEFPIGRRDGATQEVAQGKNIGMELVALTREQLNAVGIDNGIVIQSIGANSAAFKSGFQAGDIVTHFYQTPVSTVKELLDLISRARSGANVPLRILRNQRLPIYIALRIP